MEFFDRFIAKVEQLYPQTARGFDFRQHLSPLLVCPEVVTLPTKLKTEAEAIVRAFFALRGLKDRRRELENLTPELPDPGNASVLMSYDFHVDESGRLRLIEINTNASMSLMLDVLHAVQGVANPFSLDFRREIIDCFKSEYEAAGIERPLRTVAIIDENPTEQRLYAEFRCYQELFSREGFEATIHDTRELWSPNDSNVCRPDGTVIDLVYNRDTDFYFETAAAKALKAAMLARSTCITPHPHEYRLLADKERLIELGREGALESLPLADGQRRAISDTLIRTASVADYADPDELWAQRKKLFFKPMRSFGGKAAYRGGSISRRVFDEILGGRYLAQEFVAASTLPLKGVGGGGGTEEFKYDLRFFVYKDRIQAACARLYQGQMTNSQTPGGGIAVIDWV